MGPGDDFDSRHYGGLNIGRNWWAQERGDQNQVHDQDYSKNKNYQQGMRDGQDDRSHNRDHSKKRHFKKDEDQRAYEAGYQQGHGDDRSDRH